MELIGLETNRPLFILQHIQNHHIYILLNEELLTTPAQITVSGTIMGLSQNRTQPLNLTSPVFSQYLCNESLC